MSAANDNGDLDDEAVRSRIADFLSRLTEAFKLRVPQHASRTESGWTAEQVFDLLTSRDFCYLSKRAVLQYRRDVLESIRQSMTYAQPLRFHLDIGSGYHATTQIGYSELVFDVGFGELCILSQIAKFNERLQSIYSPGARFYLVVDNVCGLITNDIPLAQTEAYCHSLRNLVRQLGMDELVDLIVESEHFSPSLYQLATSDLLLGHLPHEMTSRDVENVSRFLGRKCDTQEAARRMRVYRHALEISDRLLGSLIQGVHLTQRATETTLCFRAFPGGDSRIQCGELVLTIRDGKIRPLLLTSRNDANYSCRSYEFPEHLPAAIRTVRLAKSVVSARPSPRT